MNAPPYHFPLDELHTQVMSFVAADYRQVTLYLEPAFASKAQNIASHYQIQLGDDFSVWSNVDFTTEPYRHEIVIRRNEKV